MSDVHHYTHNKALIAAGVAFKIKVERLKYTIVEARQRLVMACVVFVLYG